MSQRKSPLCCVKLSFLDSVELHTHKYNRADNLVGITKATKFFSDEFAFTKFK